MAATYPIISPGLFRSIILAGIESIKTSAGPNDPPYEFRFTKEELTFQLALREPTGNATKSLADSISQQFRNRSNISAVSAITREEIKVAAQKGLDEKVPVLSVTKGEADPALPKDRLLSLDEMLAALSAEKAEKGELPI